MPACRPTVLRWNGGWMAAGKAKGPRERATGPHNASGEAIYIPIPLDFQAIKRQDLAQAKEIRLATRKQFEAAFAAGYAERPSVARPITVLMSYNLISPWFVGIQHGYG